MNKILIVEDDPAVQSLLIRLFESEGYDVEVRADGNSALEAIHAITPMAIVLDLQLPAVSGKIFVDRSRARRPPCPSLFSAP